MYYVLPVDCMQLKFKKIQFVTHCLLIGLFNQFIFNVVIDIVGHMSAILLFYMSHAFCLYFPYLLFCFILNTIIAPIVICITSVYLETQDYVVIMITI